MTKKCRLIRVDQKLKVGFISLLNRTLNSCFTKTLFTEESSKCANAIWKNTRPLPAGFSFVDYSKFTQVISHYLRPWLERNV